MRICLSRRRFVLERLVRQEKPLQRFIQTAIVIGTVAAGAPFATAGAANAATPGELNLTLAIDCPDLAQHRQAGPDECSYSGRRAWPGLAWSGGCGRVGLIAAWSW
jgi:hypothetical protein